MKLIPIKINELRDRIAGRLEDKFLKEGFVYKKSSSQFVKTQGEYEYIFYLMIIAWSDHYSIDIKIYIRQKKIEKILKKIVGSSTNVTMGNTIGVIYNSIDGRQIVNNLMEILVMEEADVEAAVETIENYYENIAKPYFERYNSLQSIDEIINNPPFHYNPAHVGGMFDERCMKGLIVGRLVDNPNYEHLVNSYEEEIKGTMNSESIENFCKVKEYLMYNRIK